MGVDRPASCRGPVTIYVTEHGLFAQSLALMTWAFLNLVWIMLLRRPILSAALSLAMIGVLIVLSEFKHSILQINLTFLDFLIIDQDTVAFLLAIFPQLRIILFAGIVAALPLIWLFWRQDTRRIRRRTALAGVVACLGGVVASSTAWPEMPWEPFSGVNHVSNFARSGVAQVSYLVMNDWLEADRKAVSQIQGVAHETCTPATKPPHIIMVLDESSFDITAAPGIKVPEGYKRLFQIAGRQAAQLYRGSHRRPDLVHRVQRAHRPVVAFIRRVEILCHAHRRRARRARSAASLEALRLSHLLALSHLWRISSAHARSRPLPACRVLSTCKRWA
jgi:hypothetical protein